MQRFTAPLAAALALLAAGSAMGQYATIEEAAWVRPDNATRYESDSITKIGELVRFDVMVGWEDISRRPEGEPVKKVIRYLAKCKEGEIAVSSVATFALAGMTPKTWGVAPGGWDFEKPEAGSLQARWLKRTCESPLSW